MPVGRMLMKAISTSEKINGLSPNAALLFTWAIPWEDSAGYIEGEPTWMKYNVFPMRHDLSVNDVLELIIEIILAGAWRPFITDEGKRVVQDHKFEDHQRARRQDREASSSFNGHCKPVPLVEVEKVWRVPSHSGGKPHDQAPPGGPRSDPPKPKETKKGLTLKRLLDEDPEIKGLVDTLREGKFPEVGGFIGKCLKEIPSLAIDDLKQALQVVRDTEIEGNVFAYAKQTLEGIVKEGVTRRVEDQAQRFKEDEKKGTEKVGDILGRMQGGEGKP